MTRGRAIVVTGRMPWPLDDGGRIGLWQSVWSCAQDWDVTLVSLVSPGEERAELPAPFAAMGVEVLRLPHRPPALPVAATRGVFGRWPYTLARYRSRALDETLRRLIAERRPRFVWFNHLHVATSMEAVRGTPVVLREHNVEHLWLERYAAGPRTPLVRAYARHQAARMRHVERRLCLESDLVLTVQDLERDLVRRLAPGARVETVPIGVDFSRFGPRAPADPPVVLLTGSFGWPPNAEGARRFVAEGWPRIRERVPHARLRIVGKQLPADLAEQARAAGADPVGYVDDMAPEFARAALVVVPLWVGGGARVKIVEALAARVPVVSTPLGAEGLGLRPGRDDLEAETPADLADAVVSLLLDPPRAAALAASGHETARRSFSLAEVARKGNDLVLEMLARP